MGPLRLVAFLAVATLALPATSLAATRHVLPPGNSGANQYTEALPGAGGNEPTGGVGGEGGASPAKTLGGSNAARLEALGAAGRAAAQLAADTAPNRVRAAGTARGGVSGGRRQGAGIESPSGASGLSQILGQLSGSSDSGGMGLLLPLVIVVITVGSFAYLWRKRRTA